ncbi:thiamine biosynthesis lipoprotein [Streptomyces sp. Amel2xB2]|uniref:FAD:protein FMN transferase n=1 Tax=Streptomyces sp. Amel2xB2 TaxID=1305829 RepID=UPI000DB997E6|nr:FAD:protein FMN transferase [Streptomyces sp. Amel2xB2]RAJ56577.1 thiamine biosynthesis lipoprotein [Streptomyces sp. Amel2xB2]
MTPPTLRKPVLADSRPPRTAPRDDSRGVARHRCTVFGCEVAFACTGRPDVPFHAVEERLRELDRRFSRFTADSELSRLNASGGRWCTVSEEMHRLLRVALNAAVVSDGLVNIAVLPSLLASGYVRSWPPAAGEDWGERPARQRPVPPLTSVLELRGREARLLPGHALDAGALAKGLWADDVVTWLGPDAAASLGGDVSCRGPGPTGEGWPVALPGGDGTVVVRDGAVATSGVAKRRWGDGLHHLIDPRTGRPSRSDITQATVIASTGACAEWASTALVIGGSDVLPWLTGRPGVCGWRLTRTDRTEESDD